jgi:hypothetical protein
LVAEGFGQLVAPGDVATPLRMSASASASVARNSTSRSLPLKALTWRLVTTGSSGRGATAACTIRMVEVVAWFDCTC